jgi:hypothetical protein
MASSPSPNHSWVGVFLLSGAAAGVYLFKRKRAVLRDAANASAGRASTPREVPGKVFYDANMPTDAEGRVHHLHVKPGDGQ